MRIHSDLPLADYIARTLRGLIEREGIPLSNDEVLDDIGDDIDALDSESYGRVAELVSLAEMIEDWLAKEDIGEAYEWRQAALPGRLARIGKRPFTIIGIYEDNSDRWADVFWADSGEQAAEIAHAKTWCAVTVAGVIEGIVEVVA